MAQIATDHENKTPAGEAGAVSGLRRSYSPMTDCAMPSILLMFDVDSNRVPKAAECLVISDYDPALNKTPPRSRMLAGIGQRTQTR